ncbi:MAG: formylglycine-generating enzyme family protein [Chloroflexaceae bacterium]
MKPSGPTALQRLARIADGFPIRKLEAFPVAWGHRVFLGSLIVAFLIMSAGSLWSALRVPPPEQNWQVVGLADETLVELAHQTEEDWSSVAAGLVGTLPATYTLEPDQTYRMTLYGGGHRTTHEFTPERNRVLRFEGQRQAATYPCREEHPVLTITRCPELAPTIIEPVDFPTWRKQWQRHKPEESVPGDRRLSVGIELVGKDELLKMPDWWHKQLWHTGSVDVVYTIQADQADWFARAWPPIQADLSPRLAHSQVVWWTDGGDYATAELEEALAASDSVLALGSELDKLAYLFHAGDDPVITQAEIMQALQQQPVETTAAPVALFRPAQESGIVAVTTPGISTTTSADAPTHNVQTDEPSQTSTLTSKPTEMQAIPTWEAAFIPALAATTTAQTATAEAQTITALAATTTAQTAIAEAQTITAASAVPGSSIRTPQPLPAIPIPIPEMVEIPAGPFLMGSTDADERADDDEQPQHELRLETYWIGRTEVTNAQFRPFVEGDGYTNPDYWTAAGWEWREEDNIIQPAHWDDADWNGDQQPVVGISWHEAVAYARWLSAQTGYEFRLPTEAEWEKAARGTDGRIWPWGDEWVATNCNCNDTIGRTTPVGQYSESAGRYGALDMAGNVWEWTATRWRKDYPYTLENEWTAAYLAGKNSRVMRGGSWFNEQKFVRGAYRLNVNPRSRLYLHVGLRLASHSSPPAVGTE